MGHAIAWQIGERDAHDGVRVAAGAAPRQQHVLCGLVERPWAASAAAAQLPYGLYVHAWAFGRWGMGPLEFCDVAHAEGTMVEAAEPPARPRYMLRPTPTLVSIASHSPTQCGTVTRHPDRFARNPHPGRRSAPHTRLQCLYIVSCRANQKASASPQHD